METAIQEEALEAIEGMKQDVGVGQDVLINQNFNIPIFNIIWRIATNNRYSVSFFDILGSLYDFKIHSIQHDDPFISNQIKDLSQVFINAPTIAFMPWARCLMPEFIGYTLVDNFYKNMKALFNEIISAHERDYDNESLPRVNSSIDKMQTLMRSTALLSGLHRCVPKRDEKRSHSH